MAEDKTRQKKKKELQVTLTYTSKINICTTQHETQSKVYYTFGLAHVTSLTILLTTTNSRAKRARLNWMHEK